MIIGLAADHGGFELKEKLFDLLKENDQLVLNYGTDSKTRTDFPIYAFKLGHAIQVKEIDLGIAICKSGIGMSIALNKVKGVYCAKIDNINEAKKAKEHNNANCLAIDGSKSVDEAYALITAFLDAKFDQDPKYHERITMIKDYEHES